MSAKADEIRAMLSSVHKEQSFDKKAEMLCCIDLDIQYGTELSPSEKSALWRLHQNTVESVVESFKLRCRTS